MPDNFEEVDDELLGEALKEVTTELNHVNAMRQSVVNRMVAIQDEFTRRRNVKKAADYEERRRDAVMRGRDVPVPPSVVVEKPVLASQQRLSGLAGLTLNRKSQQVEVRQPEIKVVEEPRYIIGVSDHAVVRYLERAMNFDIDIIRDRILTPVVRSALLDGLNRIRTSEGLIVAREGTVVSFLPHDAGPARGGGHKIKDQERRPRLNEAEILSDWVEDD